MRALKTVDLMKMVTLFGKIGNKVRMDEGMTSQQVGLSFFSTALQYAENEFTDLLADIAELDIETFRNQPFDYPITMIEELSKNENLPLFFERVKNLLGVLNTKS